MFISGKEAYEAVPTLTERIRNYPRERSLLKSGGRQRRAVRPSPVALMRLISPDLLSISTQSLQVYNKFCQYLLKRAAHQPRHSQESAPDPPHPRPGARSPSDPSLLIILHLHSTLEYI